MKPVIGLMPLWDEGKDSLWMLPGYMDGIREAGGIPVIFPFTDLEEELAQLSAMCQGLVLTGGQDVSPEMYGQEPMDGLIEDCPKRDRMEKALLRMAIAENKPVLGICRGIQLINAALGGTLYQDLPLQHPSDVNHQQKPPYDQPAHEVTLVPGTPLEQCLGKKRIPVNSCHHQAVRDLAPGLEIMASASDGLTEAVWMPGHRFLWAVQWHPEFSWRVDENSRRIFRALMAAVNDSDRG